MPPVPSPPFCASCQSYQPLSNFNTNKLGAAYKTCKPCQVRVFQSLDLSFITILRPAADLLYVKSILMHLEQPVADVQELLQMQNLPSGRKNGPDALSPSAIPKTKIPSVLLCQSGLLYDSKQRDEDAIFRAPGFLSQFRPGEPAHDLGPMNHECQFCEAYHWIDEQDMASKQFEGCCKKGDVVLDRLRPPPDYLRSLYTEGDPLSQAFRNNIRAYNCALAFTSISYNKDKRINFSGGIQCFQIYRELFHYQGPLEPDPQDPPQFAQLFFYDPDYAASVRFNRNPQLDRIVLRQLHELLIGHNPFIELYKTAREGIYLHCFENFF